ncbi:Hypothetical protein POVN_LOCUS417 [uncultured virus]|nr:Hypothetical protein POVN_LOCUS417 [uncultured virus]
MAYRRIGRFQKKAPTGVKAPYIVFNPHSLQPLVPSESINVDWHATIVVVIDPGIKNCAIRKASRNNRTGAVETIFQVKVDFTHESLTEGAGILTNTTGMGIETVYYANVKRALKEFIEHFCWCHYIIIESQLAINYDLVRMGQHLISFMMYVTEDKGFRPLIIEIDAHLKSRMLSAPPKMTKPQLKKWAREKAIELLKERGDFATARMIEKASKGDDHGDVVLYEVIWWLILEGHLHAPPLPDIAKHMLAGSKTKADPAALQAFLLMQGAVPDKLPLPVEPGAYAPTPRSRLQVVKADFVLGPPAPVPGRRLQIVQPLEATPVKEQTEPLKASGSRLRIVAEKVLPP